MPFNIKSSGSYYATFDDSGLSANRTYTLPNVSGALLTTNSTASLAVTSSFAVTASYALSSADGGGGLGAPTAVVMKTVDESTSSSNPQDDDHLFYTFASGKTYYVELNLLVSRASAGSAQGILIVFNAGAGNGYWRLPSSATSTYFQVDGASGTIVAPALLAGVPYPVKVFISIKPTATVVGNFQFSVSSTGGPQITVHKGSHMNIWEVA